MRKAATDAMVGGCRNYVTLLEESQPFTDSIREAIFPGKHQSARQGFVRWRLLRGTGRCQLFCRCECECPLGTSACKAVCHRADEE
jgi:hypothetical protein